MDQNQNTPITIPEPTPVVPPPAPAAIIPPTEPAKPKGSSLGGMIAILIILVAVVVGALYVWGERISKSTTTPDQELQDLELQSESSDPSAIKADLEAESPEEFDTELDAAFEELDAAFDEE